MRPHLSTLAMTGLLACAGVAIADDEYKQALRGGGFQEYNQPLGATEREDYGRFEERQREERRRFEEQEHAARRRYEERLRAQDQRRYESVRDYDRGRRAGYAGPYADYREYERGYSPSYGSLRPRSSPYLIPPPNYGPPRTIFDLPSLGVPGLSAPGLSVDAYGPGYPPHVRSYEVRRPRFDPGRHAWRQVVGLSDSLVGQVNSFIQDFATTAGAVPEGPQFLAEAQTLSVASARFRELAASQSDPGRLSIELGNVEAAYGPFVARTDRIARGRTGPNIERTHAMGDTIQQLRQLFP